MRFIIHREDWKLQKWTYQFHTANFKWNEESSPQKFKLWSLKANNVAITNFILLYSEKTSIARGDELDEGCHSMSKTKYCIKAAEQRC